MKMTNTKVMTKSNNMQIDFNPSITNLVKKMVRFHRPNAIPDDVLDTLECVLRKNNTINTNIATDELNNAMSMAEQMANTWYKGQNTDNPTIIEMKKEELQKQMTITLSPSVPWHRIPEFMDDITLRTIMQKYENDQY